jgi:hypothetical protein
MDGPEQDTRRVCEEVRLLYDIAARDIAFFKTQQSTVTYYALLLYAAVVGMATLVKPSLNEGHRLALFAAASGTAAAALIAICQIQTSIQDARDRMTRATGHFSDEAMTVLSPKPSPREPVRIVWLYILILGGGLFAEAWLLFFVVK